MTVLHATVNHGGQATMTETNAVPVRVLTQNIRYATESPFKGEEPWAIRRPRLINELRYSTLYNPEAFVCLQEVLHSQLIDIDLGLNRSNGPAHPRPTVSEWAYIGVGRDDGQEAGEYSPIFYQPSKWELEMFRTVWLSKTPEVPSKSWDAASIRILTIGRFKHRESQRTVIAMNTHLDDQGPVSRYEAAKIILQEVEGQAKPDSGKRLLPVFLAGDLNSEPDQEAYQLLNDSKSSLIDLRDSIPPNDRYGHHETFTGFGYENEQPKRIDFVFIGRVESTASSSSSSSSVVGQIPEATFKARSYSVLENKFDDGVYISDHRAVVGDLLLV